MLFKIPTLPFITVMSHLSPRGREYRWGGCAPWRAVNNLLFSFIGNRDVVVILRYRTPLGQGLQAHLSGLHHAGEVKSCFLSYLYMYFLFISLYHPIDTGGSSCRCVRRRDAAPQSRAVKGCMYQDASACFRMSCSVCCDAVTFIACYLIAAIWSYNV